MININKCVHAYLSTKKMCTCFFLSKEYKDIRGWNLFYFCARNRQNWLLKCSSFYHGSPADLNPSPAMGSNHSRTFISLNTMIDAFLMIMQTLWLMEQPGVLNLLARKLGLGLEAVKPSMTLQTSHPFVMKHHQRNRLYLRRSLILQRKGFCMIIRGALRHN